MSTEDAQPPHYPGLFCTFEGPDGSGKSTQIVLLAERLRGLGHSVLQLAEPGGTRISTELRRIALSPDFPEILPITELLVVSAARAQLVGEVIRPALAAGQIVLCDRYADSTYAYQGYGHGVDLDTIRAVTHIATGGLLPDVTIYLDVPAEAGLDRKLRASQHGGEWNRLDQKGLDFHTRVRQGYEDLLLNSSHRRWLVVSGSLPPDEVAEEILAGMVGLLTENAEL